MDVISSTNLITICEADYPTNELRLSSQTSVDDQVSLCPTQQGQTQLLGGRWISQNESLTAAQLSQTALLSSHMIEISDFLNRDDLLMMPLLDSNYYVSNFAGMKC